METPIFITDFDSSGHLTPIFHLGFKSFWGKDGAVIQKKMKFLEGVGWVVELDIIGWPPFRRTTFIPNILIRQANEIYQEKRAKYRNTHPYHLMGRHKVNRKAFREHPPGYIRVHL